MRNVERKQVWDLVPRVRKWEGFCPWIKKGFPQFHGSNRGDCSRLGGEMPGELGMLLCPEWGQ